jgi:non-canonical (house-cleaning) NTP pyrophosphatase
VGLEGGVASLPDVPGTYLVMWAAATDGDRTGRGAGPSLALPGAIARRVDAGEELGPVMDDVLGEDDVARRQGAAGAFTAGGMDRADALADAVVAALPPFVSELYRP